MEWPIGLVLCYVVAGPAALAGELGLQGYPAVAPRSAAGGLLPAWPGKPFYHDEAVSRVRNFYGAVTILEVVSQRSGPAPYYLVHAGTTHGRQFFADRNGCRPRRITPRRAAWARPCATCPSEGRTCAWAWWAWARTWRPTPGKGDNYRFYEINPEVPRLARDVLPLPGRLPGGVHDHHGRRPAVAGTAAAAALRRAGDRRLQRRFDPGAPADAQRPSRSTGDTWPRTA